MRSRIGKEDYCDAARVLEHFYSICITDCGTGLLHSAMSGVLRLADQIILVSSPSVDGARSASATLDWLEAHDCGDLVRNGVVVLPELDVTFLDYPDLIVNEYGARGIGEIGMAGVAPAIASAVYHATGVRVRELPIRIEDLLQSKVLEA